MCNNLLDERHEAEHECGADARRQSEHGKQVECLVEAECRHTATTTAAATRGRGCLFIDDVAVDDV